MLIIFTFTGDNVGNPDPITLPQTVQGHKKLTIVPPAGHAWTLYDVGRTNNIARSIDQETKIERPSQGAFNPGEVVGYVALDTGSGTFTGILE